MKNLKFALTIVALVFASAESQAQRRSSKRTAAPKSAPVRQAPEPKRAAPQSGMSQALSLVRAGQFAQAAPYLYQYSRTAKGDEQLQVKFILGTTLMELKLHQMAAFQFVDIIRAGKSRYLKGAIEKLSLAADILGSDTLLNYAVSRVKVEEFPAEGRDIIYFRMGEVKMKNGDFLPAADLFAKVPAQSRYYSSALFNRGTAYLEVNRTKEAIQIFQHLLNTKARMPVTDDTRVAAQMALARAYYQAQNWDAAIAVYRDIPRDTEFWHQALFENSWALFRSARFRSTISNFQSLHSSYYLESYLPESLLLRGIVYLYICKFDEMEKVLDLFEKTYGPVRRQIGSFVSQNRDFINYYNEIEAYLASVEKPNAKTRMNLPPMVAKDLMDEGDIKRELEYLGKLSAERNRMESIAPIARSALGNQGRKVLGNRANNTKIYIGELSRLRMINVREELKDLFEQASFARYEMINGKKEQLRKRMSGKELPKASIDENLDRTYYVQNGYEYWPFTGEYWLDELGDYQYVGRQSCE